VRNTNGPTDQDKRRFLQHLTLALGAGAVALVAPPVVGTSFAASLSRADDLLKKLTDTSLRGRLTTANSPGYDSERNVYDRRYDKRPLVIAYCSNSQEVATVLSLAQEYDISFAIRSGGHGFTGKSTIDGGVIIDLSRMNKVTVSQDRNSMTLEPAARTAQVIATTSEYGKAPVTPTDGHIGLLGASLFSGQGYLSRLYGNACDNVTSAQVMLADGKIVTASPAENSDLFWAIRGAGDAFGIVLSMEMRLHDLPKTPMYCSIVYDMSDAMNIMKRYRDHNWTSPMPFPLGGFYIDPESREPRLSYLVILLGTPEENQRELDAIARFGTPVLKDIKSTTWLEAHTALPLPMNKRFYIAGRETDKQDDRTMQLMIEMIEAARKLPATQGDLTGPIVFFFPNDEGFARKPAYPASYGLRGGFEIEPLATWDNPAHDGLFEKWADDAAAAISKAGLVSKPPVIANSRVDVALMRQSFRSDYEQLVQVKRKYDPKNLFGATTVIEA
jgi:UDP-N-acetylenolpyruvoylglucosamine reductase